jgi:hypothetical protein
MLLEALFVVRYSMIIKKEKKNLIRAVLMVGWWWQSVSTVKSC